MDPTMPRRSARLSARKPPPPPKDDEDNSDKKRASSSSRVLFADEQDSTSRSGDTSLTGDDRGTAKKAEKSSQPPRPKTPRAPPRPKSPGPKASRALSRPPRPKAPGGAKKTESADASSKDGPSQSDVADEPPESVEPDTRRTDRPSAIEVLSHETSQGTALRDNSSSRATERDGVEDEGTRETSDDTAENSASEKRPAWTPEQAEAQSNTSGQGENGGENDETSPEQHGPPSLASPKFDTTREVTDENWREFVAECRYDDNGEQYFPPMAMYAPLEHYTENESVKQSQVPSASPPQPPKRSDYWNNDEDLDSELHGALEQMYNDAWAETNPRGQTVHVVSCSKKKVREVPPSRTGPKDSTVPIRKPKSSKYIAKGEVRSDYDGDDDNDEPSTDDGDDELDNDDNNGSNDESEDDSFQQLGHRLRQVAKLNLQPRDRTVKEATRVSCTYMKDNYVTQEVFVCMQCNHAEEESGVRFPGICAMCAKYCHSKCIVRKVGVVHNFRCDCGSKVLPGMCSLKRGSSFEQVVLPRNTRNIYRQSFDGCCPRCNWVLRDNKHLEACILLEEQQNQVLGQKDVRGSGSVMQCSICCERFHSSCLELCGNVPSYVSELGVDLVCKKCISILSHYLNRYLYTLGVGVAKAWYDLEEDLDNAFETSVLCYAPVHGPPKLKKLDFLFVKGFLKAICHCNACVRTIECAMQGKRYDHLSPDNKEEDLTTSSSDDDLSGSPIVENDVFEDAPVADSPLFRGVFKDGKFNNQHPVKEGLASPSVAHKTISKPVVPALGVKIKEESTESFLFDAPPGHEEETHDPSCEDYISRHFNDDTTSENNLKTPRGRKNRGDKSIAEPEIPALGVKINEEPTGAYLFGAPPVSDKETHDPFCEDYIARHFNDDTAVENNLKTPRGRKRRGGKKITEPEVPTLGVKIKEESTESFLFDAPPGHEEETHDPSCEDYISRHFNDDTTSENNLKTPRGRKNRGDKSIAEPEIPALGVKINEEPTGAYLFGAPPVSDKETHDPFCEDYIARHFSDDTTSENNLKTPRGRRKSRGQRNGFKGNVLGAMASSSKVNVGGPGTQTSRGTSLFGSLVDVRGPFGSRRLSPTALSNIPQGNKVDGKGLGDIPHDGSFQHVNIADIAYMKEPAFCGSVHNTRREIKPASESEPAGAKEATAEDGSAKEASAKASGVRALSSKASSSKASSSKASSSKASSSKASSSKASSSKASSSKASSSKASSSKASSSKAVSVKEEVKGKETTMNEGNE